MSTKSIYLVAYYYQKPRDRRVKTNRAGWMNNSQNYTFDEQVSLTNVLKNKDLERAKIILDMSKKTVIRNGWVDNRNFDDLFMYFSNGYPDQTKKVMEQIDPDYLNKLFPKQVVPLSTIDTSGSSLSSTS